MLVIRSVNRPFLLTATSDPAPSGTRTAGSTQTNGVPQVQAEIKPTDSPRTNDASMTCSTKVSSVWMTFGFGLLLWTLLW